MSRIIIRDSCEDTQEYVQIAMKRAAQNIEQLQENLSFMIQLNNNLKSQNEKLIEDLKQAKRQQQKQKQQHQKQLKKYQGHKKQIYGIVQMTKRQVDNINSQLSNKEQEINRLQIILQEQKLIVRKLQQENLELKANVNVSQSIDISRDFVDNERIHQLQKQVDKLSYQFRRSQQLNQKYQLKLQQYQQQSNQFKKWLASCLNMQKIYDNCEKIAMTEIYNRIKQCQLQYNQLKNIENIQNKSISRTKRIEPIQKYSYLNQYDD